MSPIRSILRYGNRAGHVSPVICVSGYVRGQMNGRGRRIHRLPFQNRVWSLFRRSHASHSLVVGGLLHAS